MLKFTLGLLLGLTLGGVFFHRQVKKVDAYSFKIGYMGGRLDQSQADGTSDVLVPVACAIYNHYGYGTSSYPFGYTPSQADSALKELCQNSPSLSPEQ